jgi:hypothetical protein
LWLGRPVQLATRSSAEWVPATPLPPDRQQVYGRSLGACDFHSLARAFAALGSLRPPRRARGGSGDDGADGGSGGPGVRVLWGIREASLPEGLTLADLPLGPNTRVVSWYPDNDVLSHPNLAAFVSHMGLHSLYGGGAARGRSPRPGMQAVPACLLAWHAGCALAFDSPRTRPNAVSHPAPPAAFHGAPLVALPFTLEQLDNARKGEARGMAVVCPEAPVFAPRGRPHCGPPGAGEREEAAQAGGGGGAAGVQAGGCVCIRPEGVEESIKEVCGAAFWVAALGAGGNRSRTWGAHGGRHALADKTAMLLASRPPAPPIAARRCF